jgi:hypothetical protein
MKNLVLKAGFKMNGFAVIEWNGVLEYGSVGVTAKVPGFIFNTPMLHYSSSLVSRHSKTFVNLKITLYWLKLCMFFLRRQISPAFGNSSTVNTELNESQEICAPE